MSSIRYEQQNIIDFLAHIYSVAGGRNIKLPEMYTKYFRIVVVGRLRNIPEMHTKYSLIINNPHKTMTSLLMLIWKPK